MDDNTRDAVVAAITVAGTLLGTIVGIGLGVWFQRRYRHDEVKRDAYAAFLSLGNEARLNLEALAGPDEGHQRISDDWRSRFRDAIALIDLVGSSEVIFAAADYSLAMEKYGTACIAESEKPATSRHQPDATAVAAGLRIVTDAARADLGVKPIARA